METNKNNNAGENKSKTSGAEQNPLGGFDLSGLLNNPQIAELIKHLLAGGAAMAGNYFMWIKPMQEKMEAMNTKITEQDKRIKELEKEIEFISNERDEESENREDLKGTRDEYFKLRNRSANKSSERKYRRVGL